MRNHIVLAVTLGTIVAAAVANATDVPIPARKLIVVDKMATVGSAKVVYVAKDSAASKGSGTDVAAIDVVFDLSYVGSSSVFGSFVVPAGASNGVDGWKVNKTAVAKYVNKAAPGGPTGAKVAVVKPGKLLKLVGKSRGDAPIDIVAAGNPASGVDTIYSVTNGAEVFNHCTTFPACTFKVIGGGTGAKLVCKNGTGATCPGPATTTTTSATSTTTTETSTTTTETSTTTTETSTTTSTSSTTSTSTTTSSTSSSTTTSTSTSTTTSTTTTTLAGPASPPSGGSVTYGTSGAPSPGDSGGTNFSFTDFSPDTWSRLYWGPSSAALPRAGLDGTLDALAFDSFSGTEAIWQGTSSWTNPGPGPAGPHPVPIQMRITITGLGSDPWMLSTSVTGLDPGPGTGIGAVVANFPTAVDFGGNVQFLADIPTDASGYIPLNEVPQGTGGNTVSSFTSAFYSAP